MKGAKKIDVTKHKQTQKQENSNKNGCEWKRKLNKVFVALLLYTLLQYIGDCNKVTKVSRQRHSTILKSLSFNHSLIWWKLDNTKVNCGQFSLSLFFLINKLKRKFNTSQYLMLKVYVYKWPKNIWSKTFVYSSMMEKLRDFSNTK